MTFREKMQKEFEAWEEVKRKLLAGEELTEEEKRYAKAALAEGRER